MVAHFFAAAAYAPILNRRRIRQLVICCMAAALLVIVTASSRRMLVFDEEAFAAARAMRDGLTSIGELRRRLNIPLDPALDPAGSGIIGVDYSDLTTTLGDLRAKQTSLNPQFAALIVMWLRQAGVRPGDRVALSITGSFPALNMAALYACASLRLDPVIISSVGASSYGANIPGFTWLDMERHLHAEGRIPWLSSYASLGGIVETGGGLDGTGVGVGEAAIARHGARYLREEGPRDLLRDIERRQALYFAPGPPKAFINVGGAITSLGWVAEAALLGNGMLTSVPQGSNPKRGIIFRMVEAGVPVINLLNIERLAAEHHLQSAPTIIDPDLDRVAARRTHHLLLVTVLFAWFGVAGGFIWAHSRRNQARTKGPGTASLTRSM
jgi:poly-gamma-glutamate system protein